MGPGRGADDTLRSVLGHFRIAEVLRLDLVVGVAGCVAAGVLAAAKPALAVSMADSAVGLIGVVVGSVLASASLIAAFLNPVFIRKLRGIGEDPADYLAPYLFTGVLATVGALLAVALAATPTTAPSWWMVPLSAALGLFGTWAIASMVPNLTNVIRFIRLQQEAAEVPDDISKVRPLGERQQR